MFLYFFISEWIVKLLYCVIGILQLVKIWFDFIQFFRYCSQKLSLRNQVFRVTRTFIHLLNDSLILLCHSSCLIHHTVTQCSDQCTSYICILLSEHLLDLRVVDKEHSKIYFAGNQIFNFGSFGLVFQNHLRDFIGSGCDTVLLSKLVWIECKKLVEGFECSYVLLEWSYHALERFSKTFAVITCELIVWIQDY